MKICILSATAWPQVGGVEIVLNNLSTALTMLGHRLIHITPYPKRIKARKDNFSYQVVRFGFKGDGRLKLIPLEAFLTLAYVVKRYKIDIINVHNVFTPGSWAYYYKKLNKDIPIIGTPHGDDVQITADIQDGVRLNPKFDAIVRRNLNAFDRITAISPSIREDLNELVNDHEKIVDIPNGVWVDDFRSKQAAQGIRRKYQIPSESTVIISIGRNHPRKGFEYGLEAFRQLRSSGLDVYFFLVGRWMDVIREKAQEMGIGKYLITPGEVDYQSVASMLAASDIYLSPSIVESFGMTTLEAMAAGLPCVVTDIPGTRDIVRPEFGTFVEPRNSEQLFNAIKALIENAESMRKMGAFAQEESKKYDWRKIAERYVETYKECCLNKICH